MADSISDNTAIYQKFQYVAPATLNHLIDQTTFTIDFPNRKVIRIDPSQKFQRDIVTTYHNTITPRRNIVRLFKTHLFLDGELYVLSSPKY